jgi:S1-C subfamily serine protease
LRSPTSHVTVEGESWPAGGDLIVKADGRAVSTIESLIDVIAAKEPGDQIDLEVIRGTRRIHVTVKLGRQS